MALEAAAEAVVEDAVDLAAEAVEEDVEEAAAEVVEEEEVEIQLPLFHTDIQVYSSPEES